MPDRRRGGLGHARGRRGGDWSTTYGPGARLSWLLFDFGGRAGASRRRSRLLAADWTHNAVIQDAILDVEIAFYRYAGAKAILEANRASYAEAESSVVAAEARHEVGSGHDRRRAAGAHRARAGASSTC